MNEMLRINLITIIFIFLLCSSLLAQLQPNSRIITAQELSMVDFREPAGNEKFFGTSGNADAELTAFFDAVTDSLWDQYSMVGFSASVVLGDGTVWKGATGLSSSIVPITTEHRLGMGSITKTFTAAALLKLQEQGLLSMNDTIGQWFSGIQHIPGSVTIRQLLRHQSGITEFLSNIDLIIALNANLDSVWEPMNILNNYMLPPTLDPGTSWNYSNTNYLLAGIIIELVSGQPFHKAVRELVIEPFELESIRLFPQENIGMPVANAWGDIGFGTVVDMHAAGIGLGSLYSAVWAAGANYSKADELGTWMHALMSGEILNSESMAQMNDVLPLNTFMGYGLGMIRMNLPTSNGIQVGYGHNGYIYYGASSYYFPALDITITAMTNDGGFDGEHWPMIIAAYLEAYFNWMDISTSIKEVSNEIAFYLYPNPAQEYICFGGHKFAVSPEFTTNAFIYNSVGKLVHSENLEKTRTGDCIILSSLPAGIYFLKLQNESDTGTFRFVITD